jgi:hypothetical protein
MEKKSHLKKYDALRFYDTRKQGKENKPNKNDILNITKQTEPINCIIKHLLCSANPSLHRTQEQTRKLLIQHKKQNALKKNTEKRNKKLSESVFLGFGRKLDRSWQMLVSSNEGQTPTSSPSCEHVDVAQRSAELFAASLKRRGIWIAAAQSYIFKLDRINSIRCKK